MKRKSVMMMLALTVAVALAGCSFIEVSDTAKVPLGSGDVRGMEFADVQAQFQEAGFTNIETEEKETKEAEDAGAVRDISVDGKGMFKAGDRFVVDAPVIITYYVLVAEPEPEQTEAPEVVFDPGDYTADATSLEKLATELFAFEYSDLKVEWDDFDSAFVVSYLPDAILDETSYVHQSVNRYIYFCQYAYQIDGVERVRFDVMLEVMDQYGQTETITGVSEIMTREDFEKFNWDNLAYTNIWDSFSDNCYYFGFPPLLGEKLDTSKVFYDPFTRDGKIT